MAEKYGFQYELVQYRWPRWLHQQTEKQRIIWGYKILFLDVLFPLAVDKIIFVDADQVIRLTIVFKNTLTFSHFEVFSSVQLLSRIRLCDPTNCSTPGLPVYHQLPEFTQTHVHRVGDAIQPSHPLSSLSPPAPKAPQHQNLFQ